MVLAYILSVLVAVILGALIEYSHCDLDQIGLPIAQLTSVTVLVLLVMLGGRQSLPTIFAATSIRQAQRTGGVLLWIPLAILAGLVFRFGTSGLAYGVVETVHLVWPHALNAAPAQNPPDPNSGIDAMLIVSIVIGASIEEFTYRRILQSYFCHKFGLWTGVIGVAVAFGAMHASLVIMLVGICLALLYLYSGRLWVSILAHVTGNLAVPALASLQLEQGVLLVACTISAVLLVAATALAIGAIRRFPRIYT